MSDEGYRAVARALAEGAPDHWVRLILEAITARIDLADHRLLVVLKLRLAGADLLPDELRQQIDEVLLGFRYSFTEPGDDSMCSWSENHQLLFATGEYLAGRLLADQVFTNSGRLGHAKAADAEARLTDFLEDRFRWGWSEWLSATFAELDICALVLLADYAQGVLAERAAMVLDLTLLDLALHHFDSVISASQGRAYRAQKLNPRRQEVIDVIRHAFGGEARFSPDQVSGIFIDAEYRTPQVIAEIAHAGGAHRVEVSHGRELSAVIAHARHRAAERGWSSAATSDEIARMAWSQQAITDPEVVSETLATIRRHGLISNTFFARLRPFVKVRGARLAAALVKSLHPVTLGMNLGCARVRSWRTPHASLVSAQHYRVNDFGDQQHLWQAALPGGIAVFSTHPGSTGPRAASRPPTPSDWVGNGVNPDIGQADNVVLVLHDLRTRPGYLEGDRPELSHLHFPFALFDETKLTERMVLGRKGDAYLAVLSAHPCELISDRELLQRGLVTGWAVVVSDRSEHSSFDAFVSAAQSWSLRLGRHGLELTAEHVPGFAEVASRQSYQLTWQHELHVNGLSSRSDFGRYDCQWISMPHGGTHAVVRGETGVLVLDFLSGTRRCE